MNNNIRRMAHEGRSIICLVDNNSSMLINFRLRFIEDLARRYEVRVMCPFNPKDAQAHKAALAGAGVAQCIDNPYLHRRSMNPLRDLALYAFYKKMFRAMKPDLVFNYTVKCGIWSSLAAKRCGVPAVFSMITGLGYSFTDASEGAGARNKKTGRNVRRNVFRNILGDLKKKIARAAVSFLYKRALAGNARVFFLNPDDRDLFAALRLVRHEQAVVLAGEGVDLERFAYNPAYPKAFTALVLSRLLADKGILEYYEAAKLMLERHKSTGKSTGTGAPPPRFLLAGPRDDNPSTLNDEEFARVTDAAAGGPLEYLGALEDVRPAIAQSSVLVLASYYREGTPRSILEAMAMGRPVITTDAPGCRETVEDGVSGFIIPVKDHQALAHAMEQLLQNPGLVADMGRRARERAEKIYDVRAVNWAILRELELSSHPNIFAS